MSLLQPFAPATSNLTQTGRNSLPKDNPGCSSRITKLDSKIILAAERRQKEKPVLRAQYQKLKRKEKEKEKLVQSQTGDYLHRTQTKYMP